MTNKVAQHTKLDEWISGEPTYRPHEQAVLPFKDFNIKHDLENIKPKKKKPEAFPIRYPELTPEQLKYRGLSEQELNRLREGDEAEREYRERYRYYGSRKDEPLPGEHYYELNKLLPEEAKQKVLAKYNELRKVAAEFYKQYQEANQMASEMVELSYEGSYFDLVKNFSKFVVNAAKASIGMLFGAVPETGYRRDHYSGRARTLAEFINKGLNLFNITPLNINVKIHEMRSAIHAMQAIMQENARRHKLLKKLPEEVNQSVKRYLMKKDVREFLKWMDEYFPNDKQEFIENNISELLQTYSTNATGPLRMADLQKFKTYVGIYYKAQRAATHDLFQTFERKTKSTIEERLKEELKQRALPKFNLFKELLQRTNREDMKELEKTIFKIVRLDVVSIFNFVKVVMQRKYEGLVNKDVEKEMLDFKGNFLEDLRENLKNYIAEERWSLDSLLNEIVGKFMREYVAPKGERYNLDIKRFSELTSKDLDKLVVATLREVIISAIPNFKGKGWGPGEYTYPDFSDIGHLIKKTGKFSIDSITNYMHAAVPFVPKEFVLNLVRTLFKNAGGSGDKNVDIMKAFKNIYYLKGTGPALSMKILMALLKKSNKFNPNSFITAFVNHFEELNHASNTFGANVKTDRSDEETVEMFLAAIRSIDTLERDLDNFRNFVEFLHNSAGNLGSKDLMKIFLNKNFLAYSKTGIAKKLLRAYTQIRNMNGLKGIYTKYGEIINLLKEQGYVSKKFDTNIRFVIRFFNSNEDINPSNPLFSKMFQITSELETDLQTIAMSEALKDLIKDYEPKDERLFRLDLQINDRLRFRVLKDKDPRALRVGVESDCCQRIGGVGEAAAKDSFVNPLASVVILEWKNDQGEWVMLTQSYFHYVPSSNAYILDNVESNRKNVSDSEIHLETAYAYLANEMKKRFDVEYFVAGKAYSKLSTSLFKTHKLRGRDPRYFSPKAGSPYSDYTPSNGIDLLHPKFDANSRIQKMVGKDEGIKQAFEVNLRRIILGSMLVA